MVFGRGSLLKYLLIVGKKSEKPPAQFGSLNTAMPMRRLNLQRRSIQVNCAVSLFDE